MSKKDNPNKYATKKDVEEIVNKAVKGAVTEISEVIVDSLQMISDRFDKVESDIGELKDDVGSLKATTNRIENKLNPTIEIVDEHSRQLRELKMAAA